jgi:hypothetical protein
MSRLALLPLLPLLLFGCLGGGSGDDPPSPTEPIASSAMSIADRADRIRQLQTGHTDSAEEREILDIFLALRGEPLRELKRTLDDGRWDGHLMHLVHSDIDDEAVRAALLAHLARSADGLQIRPIRVLSDIDDTIYASLHDTRYPKGTLYPGVLAFYRELAGVAPETQGAGFVTFISARPGDRGGLVERVTRETLTEFGFDGATLLAGTLRGLRSHEAMAQTKRTNLARYRALYPEYRFVFVGDSGQGDAAFGAMILADFPDDVLAVFIHDVVNEADGRFPLPAAERAVEAGRQIYYFDTYPDAARIAQELQLLDAAAVERVEAAAAAAEASP